MLEIKKGIANLISGTQHFISFKGKGHEIYLSEFMQEINLYDEYLCHLTEKFQKDLKIKIEKITQELRDFLKITKDNIISREERENSIVSLIYSLREDLRAEINSLNEDESSEAAYQEEPLSLKIKKPSWVKDLKFSGSKDFYDHQADFVVTRGQTTGEIVLMEKRKEDSNKLFQHGFIISVLNCEVENPTDSKVSLATLINATPNDLEVIDSAHELERVCKKDGAKFGYGVVKIDNKELKDPDLEVEDKYGLEETMCEYFGSVAEGNSSAIIFIISQSNNLLSNNITKILEKIPFQFLKENDITDLNLEIISCNTLGIAEELKQFIKKTAINNSMKITSHFYNGFLYNNVTYLYTTRESWEKLESQLHKSPTLSQFSISSESPSSSSPPEIASSSSFKTVIENPQLTLLDSPLIKTSRLIQVITEGFSNIKANDVEELKEIVFEKIVKKIEDKKVTKKLICPKARVEQAIVWELEADYRQNKLSRSPSPLISSTLKDAQQSL